MIFQLHEKHGKHMAINLIEAQSNEKNGWKTVTEEEFYGVIKVKDIVDGAIEKLELTEEEAKAAYKQIFGKKPHHKMKLETILEKINANGS